MSQRATRRDVRAIVPVPCSRRITITRIITIIIIMGMGIRRIRTVPLQ
jgi:hypothetical protein